MNIEPLQLLSALSDATRLRVVALLAQRDELCVCEIVHLLDCGQPKVSKHLRILRETGIIIGRRDGQWIHYRLNPELPVWARGAIDQLLLGCATRVPFREDKRRFCSTESGLSCGS